MPSGESGHSPAPDEVVLVRPPPPTTWLEHARQLLSWFGIGRLAAVSLSVLAVGAGGYWLLRAPPTPVESTLPTATAGAPSGGPAVSAPPPASTATPPAVADPAAAEVVVHVAGAVGRPGVVRLAAGARVVDAVDAAGGAAADADLDALNLAALATDGQQVYVPRVGEAGGGASTTVAAAAAETPPSASSPLDLNSADVVALDALPGVGPATASAIVAYRDEHGPFVAVDQLLDVPGIGPAKLEVLRPLVRT